LLDSGRPGAQELGGTGRAHDWVVSRRIVEAVGKRVFLAG
jgi:phosphoribosylanthranilate isomerase